MQKSNSAGSLVSGRWRIGEKQGCMRPIRTVEAEAGDGPAAAARTLERETDARMAGDQLESRRNMSTHFTPKGSLSSILHGRRYAPPPLLNPPAFRVHCGYVLAVRSAPTRPHRVLLFGHASITPTARTKGRRSWRLRFPFPTWFEFVA